MVLRDWPDLDNDIGQVLRTCANRVVRPLVAGLFQEFAVQKQDVVGFKSLPLAAIPEPGPVGYLRVFPHPARVPGASRVRVLADYVNGNEGAPARRSPQTALMSTIPVAIFE